MGANAVSVPWEDVYISLQTKVIDGVMTNYDGFHMMKFYEPAKHIIFAPQLWWATPFLHTINLDTWNKLPPDIQEGILKATEIAQQKFGEVFASKIEQIMAEQKAAGCEVKIADEKDAARVADENLLGRLRGIWVEEAVNKMGLNRADAEGYIQKMKQIMENAIAKEH
ncbi:MAG: TRAP transporter substrate-binding protein [Desulfofundulus sp.]